MCSVLLCLLRVYLCIMGLTCEFIKLGREKMSAFGAIGKIKGVQN